MVVIFVEMEQWRHTKNNEMTS